MGRFFFALNLLLSASCLGQTVFREKMYKDLEVTNIITKSFGDSSYSFHVATLDHRSVPDFEKKYYWFSQNELKSTQGNYTGKLLHGDFEKFDSQGNLLEKGSFEYGLKDDIWLTWHRNGRVATTLKWDDGLRMGEFREFYSNGNLHRSGRYRNDKLHGTLEVFDEVGALTARQRYRNGKLLKEKIRKKKEKARETDPGANTSQQAKERRRKKKDETRSEEVIQQQSDSVPVRKKERSRKREKRSDQEQQTNH